MIKKFFLLFFSACFFHIACAQETPEKDTKTLEAEIFRITVNGIFPESKTDQWAGVSLSDELLEQSHDVVRSINTSILKKDNAPKLRVEPSHAKRGKAYTVNGKRYVPFSSISEFSQVGIASWYGPGFHGKKTANGELFDQHDLTAAHKELPINSMVRVTRVSTGKSIIVRINDRGPFHQNRVIDLSYGAAKKLGMVKKGADKVKIELIGQNGTNPVPTL